ncbi:GNAT family N-acetyltransferase [Kocuria tytonicola]|uniref:GNAT family N-acetyltransferase n=1 Tax=Kocuria tytonicola TaxID=2055946 RepID=UPI000EF8EC57|nr:GNAT family N-acetyltransferase [Kocuria tytonicola]RLZ03528.1 GNAT family N-acetyltransferase [Kocuria tytonicola]
MTTDTPFTLRTPTPQDTLEIAAVHVQTWRETYAGLVPERFFGDAARQARQKLWTQLLADPAARRGIHVAEANNAVIGFAGTGRPTEPDPARERALRMLYVLREHHGTGVGQALLDAALGDQPAQLWVAEANPRAIRFYERNGFRADGTVLVDPALENLREIRLVR